MTPAPMDCNLSPMTSKNTRYRNQYLHPQHIVTGSTSSQLESVALRVILWEIQHKQKISFRGEVSDLLTVTDPQDLVDLHVCQSARFSLHSMMKRLSTWRESQHGTQCVHWTPTYLPSLHPSTTKTCRLCGRGRNIFSLASSRR